MSDQGDLERGLSALYKDPPELPQQVLNDALDRASSTRQRRFGPIPVLRPGRGSAKALVWPIAAALVLVAGGFALSNLLGEPRDASIVPAASPSSSPSAMDPLQTGARIVIAQDGSGDASTIEEALGMAADGDTLIIRPGTYIGGVTLERDMTILGDGPREAIVVIATDESSTIDLDETVSYAFLFRESDATLTGLTLRNAGATSFVPIVAIGGAPTIEDVDAGGTIRLTDAADATVRGNRMAGLEMIGELGDPEIADNVTSATRAEVEAALMAGVNREGCGPWREPDEPFLFGSAGAIRCGEPVTEVSQLALFAFDDPASLGRFWHWRVDGLGVNDLETGIDCGDGSAGLRDWEHGSLVCYEDATTGLAKIRWTDLRDLTYGVVDSSSADVAPAFSLWQEQTQP